MITSLIARCREPVSGLTHLVSAILAAIGTVVLLWLGRDSPTKFVSLLIYCTSLTVMFSASAAYHLSNSTPAIIANLRRFDHASIYTLIAGTYTPICLHYFTGFWRWGMLATIWSMALVGVVGNLIYMKAPRWLTTGIYLLMGWLSIMAIKEILLAIPTTALLWLILGGLFFTAGAVVYMLKTPNFSPHVFGFHEIWHIFVMLGCFSHFIVIAVYIAPYPSPV